MSITTPNKFLVYNKLANLLKGSNVLNAAKYLYFHNNFLMATTGQIIVRINMTSLGFSEEVIQLLKGKAITKETYSDLMKCSTLEISDTAIRGSSTSKTGSVSTQIHEFADLPSAPPLFDAIIPNNFNICLPLGQDGTNVIGMTLDNLALIHAALPNLKAITMARLPLKGRSTPLIWISSPLEKVEDELILLMPVVVDFVKYPQYKTAEIEDTPTA